MSVAVSGSFPSSKATEENRGRARKAGSTALTHSTRKHTSGNPVHPQKNFSAPLATPRKALGNISNSSVTTPAHSLKQQSQTLPVKKATATKATAKPSKTTKSKESSVKKPQTTLIEEDFPDIELMPTVDNKDFSDAPFVPPSYFHSLRRALRVNPIPPFLGDFPLVDALASLTIETDVRPSSLHKGNAHSRDDFESVFLSEKLPPVEMPDIPDFSDF